MSIALRLDWSKADPFGPVRGWGTAGTVRHRHVSVMADARLDNAEDLRTALDAREARTTEELLARAYLRWGESFPEHLAGDFAVVLWDASRRRLLAARDPFGVKPLYYRRDRLTWVCSRIEPIIGTFNGAPALDDEGIVEHLLAIFRSTSKTVFRDIFRVPAGHLAVFESPSVRHIRYWRPNNTSADRADAQLSRAHADEFTRLFEQAIQRRVIDSPATVVHVSGGIDSSSIATVHAGLIAASRIGPGLLPVTASYPGLACDEGAYVRTVEEWTAIQVDRWDGTLSSPVDLLDPAIGGPGSRRVFTDGTVGDLEAASRSGSRVILSGTGGDELTIGAGTVPDMLRYGEWIRAARRILVNGGPTARSRSRRIKALAEQYLPVTVRAARARTRVQLPAWLTPRLEGLARDIATPAFADGEPGHAASNVWKKLNSAQLISTIEGHQTQALPFGVEYRFPFLDVDLVRFVLRIAGGYWPAPTRPHQRALANRLPPAIANRHSKADLTPAFQTRIVRATPLIERLLLEGEWLSVRYVSRGEALAGWRRFQANSVNGFMCRRIWAMVTLEAWLRRFFSYTTSRPGGIPYDGR